MKYVLANLGANLVALACAGGAIYLAANQREGWGWFLFVALCCACSVTFGKKGDEVEKSRMIHAYGPDFPQPKSSA